MNISIRLPLALLLACALASSAAAQSNVFAMPLLQPRHAQLVQQFRQQVQRGDYAAMEEVCRAGVALLPDDPTWRYNLACALARQQRSAEALDALATAVARGFRDAQAIAGDADLASLRRTQRFAELLATARRTRHEPVPGKPVMRPALVGEQATISAENTTWNFDLGCFHSFFAIPTNRAAPPLPVALEGPAGEVLRGWISESSAAGNHGDLYDNRDAGHSRLDLRLFPEMRPVVYDAAARQAGAHNGLSSFLFNGAITIGNSSTARTQGPFWRSNPRQAYVDGRAMLTLSLQYLRNQLYVYPRHRDYDPNQEGDVFPAVTPYLVISDGSSGSDQPILRALAATLAAMRPEVKRSLTAQGMIAPTLQMLLRASQRGVTNRLDYLTRRAHPVTFAGDRLDLARMITLAHDLRTNALPPFAALRCVEEERAVVGRDFFDAAHGEVLFDTPAAIARVIRGMAYTRRIVIDAANSRDPQGLPLTWHWFVLQGDPARIRIVPRNAARSSVSIEVDYHGGAFPVAGQEEMRSSRVEIALCVDNGVRFSPPALVSFYYLNNEARQYSTDGRILAVDYEAAANRYTDPLLSLPRRWRDLYLYDKRNRLAGWSRFRGQEMESFTADGARVLTRDARGRALTARTVLYRPQAASGVAGGDTLPEIAQADGDKIRSYRYAGDDDIVGELVSEEP